MTTLNGEAEAEIIALDRQTYITLGIGLTIATLEYQINISSCAVIGYRCNNVGIVHSSKPCSPVSLTATRCASSIAIAPTIVVGTKYGILGVVITGEHGTYCIPVGRTIGIVLEADFIGLAYRY